VGNQDSKKVQKPYRWEYNAPEDRTIHARETCWLRNEPSRTGIRRRKNGLSQGEKIYGVSMSDPWCGVGSDLSDLVNEAIGDLVGKHEKR